MQAQTSQIGLPARKKHRGTAKRPEFRTRRTTNFVAICITVSLVRLFRTLQANRYSDCPRIQGRPTRYRLLAVHSETDDWLLSCLQDLV